MSGYSFIFDEERGDYYAKENSTIRAHKVNAKGCEYAVYGGGGGTKIYQPSPPQPPTVGEGIEAWIENLPEIYQTQMEYAPKLAEQQVSLAQQYAAPYGQAIREAQAEISPETTALQEQLAGEAAEGMETPVPESVQQEYLDTLRGNLGTNIGSPIGAEYTSRKMAGLGEDWRRYYRDLGLSVAGRQPLAQPSVPQTPQWTGGFTPQNVMSNQMQGYGTYAPQTRPMMYQQQSNIPNYMGGMGGMAMGLGGMGFNPFGQ